MFFPPNIETFGINPPRLNVRLFFKALFLKLSSVLLLSMFFLQADVGDDCSQPADLKVKSECKTEPSSPQPSPTEDQTEPVDLSLNKPRSSSTANPSPGAAVMQPSLPATPVPSAVQSIGSMVTTPSNCANCECSRVTEPNSNLLLFLSCRSSLQAPS